MSEEHVQAWSIIKETPERAEAGRKAQREKAERERQRVAKVRRDPAVVELGKQAEARDKARAAAEAEKAKLAEAFMAEYDAAQEAEEARKRNRKPGGINPRRYFSS